MVSIALKIDMKKNLSHVLINNKDKKGRENSLLFSAGICPPRDVVQGGNEIRRSPKVVK